MKNLTAVALVALTVIAAPIARASEAKEVGLGVVAGDPIGGTAKFWIDDRLAFDLGAGFSGDTALWGDVLMHSWDLLPKPAEGRLGAYAGAGPRLETKTETEFALRTILGVSWRLDKEPVEVFAEAGPTFRMAPSGGVGVDAGVGVRLFVGGRRR